MGFNKLHRYDTFGAVIATLEWRKSPGRTFEVHIDVEPSYQRQGIGRQLIQELEQLVADQEPMSLYTFMAADNDQAVKFFKGVGFHLYRVDNFYGYGRDGYMGIKAIGTPK